MGLVLDSLIFFNTEKKPQVWEKKSFNYPYRGTQTSPSCSLPPFCDLSNKEQGERNFKLTLSEGLNGFPCPLIPPLILNPRPGFFSILTQNWVGKRGMSARNPAQAVSCQSPAQLALNWVTGERAEAAN